MKTLKEIVKQMFTGFVNSLPLSIGMLFLCACIYLAVLVLSDRLTKINPSKEEILQKKIDSLENVISKEKSIQILQTKIDSLENIISKEGYYGTN